MDDHLADLLSQGKGMGFGTKMAEQLIQQANAAKLSGNGQIAVKPINAPREVSVSAETIQGLQRPDGFVGAPK
jgi:Rod binding domain-containing protein